MMNSFSKSRIGRVMFFILGLFLFAFSFNFFLLPNVVYTTNALSIILSIVSTIIVVELATIIATLELDKITPVEILKNQGSVGLARSLHIGQNIG